MNNNFNEVIIETLKDYKIPLNNGLAYLLCVYYDVKPDFIPDSLKSQVLTSGIFTTDSKNSITWRIPLFKDGKSEEENYEWVKGWVQSFKDKNNNIPRPYTECVRRFKKFFRTYPNYTVEDVKKATEAYFKSVNDYSFLKWPHYFISKDGHSMLLDYLNEIKEQKEEIRTSLSNTMK